MSEIISLGLDISSFDDSKKTRLTEYIALFEQLEKYENKKYSPVLGDGLTAFNASVAETSKLIEDLNIKLNSLNTTTTQTSAAAKGTAAANNEANKALSTRAASAIKAAEAETRLSAANTKNAQALLTRANAEARAANSALQNASSTEKATLAAQNTNFAQTATAAALNVRVSAERQLIAANTQLALAETEMAAGSNLSAQAQQRLQTAVDSGRIATVNAASAVEGANAGIATSTQQLAAATDGASGFGRSLGHAFGQLRTLAYILPGIGIAGIFNAAFTAIGKVIEELGIFDNALKKELETQILLNKSISEEFDIRESIKKQREGIFQNTNTSSSSLERDKNTLSASGAESGLVLAADKKIADQKLIEAKSQLPNGFPADDAFLKNSIKVQERLKKEREEIKAYLEAKNTLTGFQTLANSAIRDPGKTLKDLATQKTTKVIDGKLITYDKDLEKDKLETRLQVIGQEEKINNLSIQNTKNYLDALSGSSAAQASINKFNADEARKKRIEIAKGKNDSEIERAKAVFEKETSSLKEKEGALVTEKLKKDDNARLARANVITNNSSTGAEISIANAKLPNDILSNQRELNKKLFDLRESYRQRLISAQTDIAKAEEEQESIKNEKIANNEEKGLDERLVALSKYIDIKQKIQEEEYLKDKERLSLKANDPVARKELVALEKTYQQQKLDIQADAEKKAFDITKTSLAKQFNDVKHLNEQLSTEDTIRYTAEIDRLNKSFNDKEISIKRYKIENAKIDKEYKVKIIQEDIKDKKEDLARFKDLQSSEQSTLAKANEKVTAAEFILRATKRKKGDVGEAQKGVDLAKGERDGVIDGLKKTNSEIEKGEDAINKLKEKNALAERDRIILIEDQKIKKRKETVDAIAKVEKAIYDAAKKYSDAEYKLRSNRIEERLKSATEGTAAEISAIEKSSISEKDKAALSIQIQTKKLELEKAAAVEQKRLKIDQANFDKQLSIAHILFGTAEAIISAGAVTPRAIAAGIVGAIELAAAIATPIPSFAEGVENFEGGVARYGEAGSEVIKEPNKKPYLATRETISFLPKGTDVIPIAKYHVEEKKMLDNSWEQTIWLAKQMKKNNTKIVNRNMIIVDLGFSNYKKQILGN